MVRPNNLQRRQSKTNNSDNDKKNIHARSRSLSPAHRGYKQQQGHNPSRTTSKTEQQNNDTQEQKINKLEEEIKRLKETQKVTNEAKDIKDQLTSTPNHTSKNFKVASGTNRGQQENLDLLTVMNFVEETMKTLSIYGEQLKNQLKSNQTQQGM